MRQKRKDLLAAASEQIRHQSRELRRELDREIDVKLRRKLKEHEGVRHSLRSSINVVRESNEKLYEEADGKLEKLEKSIEVLHALSKELNCMKSESEEMNDQCNFIKGRNKCHFKTHYALLRTNRRSYYVTVKLN